MQASTVRHTAELGTRGAGAAMPHAAAIQRSFGRHDLGNIRAHVGGPATEAAHAIGATAYALGNHVAFDRTPDLATAAHEATHVWQQRSGVSLPNGIGHQGDTYERHAEAVAALVTQGRSAEPLLDRPLASGSSRTGVQRLAFINETQVTNRDPSFTPAMRRMMSDGKVRNYTGTDEFQKHADNRTDYLGNLANGTWLRFSPTGINLLGENHTEVTLEDVVPAVGTKSFIYEPISSDKMAPGSKIKAAYETENRARFRTFGIEKEKDKQPFGAESLIPKMGYSLTVALPFFEGKYPISAMMKGNYVGQPIQRYLKIAWAYSQDNKLEVEQKLKAKQFVEPKSATLAKVHGAVADKLDPFITSLVVDGYLGDAIAEKKNIDLLPLLAEFAQAFTEAMVRKAAADSTSRLSVGKRLSLSGSSKTSEADKTALFTQWRDFMFEDNVAAATKRGVRYAGMGLLHLQHLISVGLEKNQHPFDMTGKDIAGFTSLTDKLKKAAKKP